MLSTASLSALGYENSRDHPVIRLWNETHHLRTSDDRQTDAKQAVINWSDSMKATQLLS